MHNTQDLFIAKDIFPVFDHTQNDDAKAVLKKIFLQPLTSVAAINDRQDILKALTLQDVLIREHQYRKVDYLEVQRFLLYFSQDELKKTDYLTYLFQQKRNDAIFGLYSQLIYFFKDIEDNLKQNLIIKNFPKNYQADLHFVLKYLAAFQLSMLKAKIVKQKFGYRSIQSLNKLVLEKRRNGNTMLFYEKLNQLEAYISISVTIRKLDLKFANMGASSLQLKGFYHPLVKDAVRNDLQVENNVVLITGANMSGKSTLLKSLALCVYLAHLGLPVAASYGQIPFYDSIFVQINHSDDLKNGYSHFMNEILNLKSVVEQVKQGKSCFAVFDELFKGTNHEDALQISKRTIQGLQEINNSLFFISTHLTELKTEVQERSMQTLYIDCVIDNGTPVFSYKLKDGWSDLKIGQLLFNKVGLDDLLCRTSVI